MMTPAHLEATELMRQTLRLYGELVSRREGFGGQLVLCCGAGSSGSGLPAAVSIAGGTTLVIDSDASSVKAVFRRGGIDFVVNTLDEALRVLKNEVRRHKPLSVGLTAGVQATLAQMVARGVLPDWEVSFVGEGYEGDSQANSEALLALETEGMQSLLLRVKHRLVVPSRPLEQWLGSLQWHEVELEATSAVEQRAQTDRLLGLLAKKDDIRCNWLQRISHYQRLSPGTKRVVWLTEEEQQALKA